MRRIIILSLLLLGWLSLYDLPSAQSDLVISNGQIWESSCVACPAIFEQITNQSAQLDNNGIPCITYGGGYLYYGCRDPIIGWEIELVDDQFPIGFASQLLLDHLDEPHLFYLDDTNHLYHTYKVGVSWEKELLEVEVASNFYSVGIDSLSQIHLAYYGVDHHLYYLLWDGVSWASAELVDDFGDVGASLSLAIDQFEQPGISYFDLSTEQLKFAKRSGGSWNIFQFPYSIKGGVGTDLLFDQDNKAHIAFNGETDGSTFYVHTLLWYLREMETDWQLELVDRDENVGGTHIGLLPSLILDSDGLPHISYGADWRGSPTFPPISGGEVRYSWKDSDEEWYQMGLSQNDAVETSMIDGDSQSIIYLEDNQLVWWVGGSDEPIDRYGYWGGGLTGKVDMNGDLHAIYYNDRVEEIWVSRPDGSGGWLFDLWGDNEYSAIPGFKAAVSDSGLIHTLYKLYDQSGRTLLYRYEDGAGGIQERYFFDGGALFGIAIDHLEKGHIVYSGAWGGMIYVDSSGTAVQIDSEIRGEALSILVDSANLIHFVVSGPDGIYLYEQTGVGWNSGQLIEPDEAYNVFLYWDQFGGEFYLSYEGRDGIYYLRENGGSWDKELIIPYLNGGGCQQIALSADGVMHHLYLMEGNLVYGRFDGSWWERYLVTDEEVWDCSLLLDQSERPLIFYQDAVHGHVKMGSNSIFPTEHQYMPWWGNGS